MVWKVALENGSPRTAPGGSISRERYRCTRHTFYFAGQSEIEWGGDPAAGFVFRRNPKGTPEEKYMEPKIDAEKLMPSDRVLIVQFTNCMRDLDTIAVLAKPTTRLSESAKRKLWNSVEKNSAKPIEDSLRVLKQLINSAHPELRRLAEQCIDKDSGAIGELRRLGRRLKQDQ